jgi:putative Mg2+ transporter-C (MgtC) family protein
LQIGMEIADASRVLQGVIAGIGFLGAGAIIKHSGSQEIKGLTTAASIWVAAAVGIAAGMGLEATAVVSTLAALFILAIVKRIEISAGIDENPLQDLPDPSGPDDRSTKVRTDTAGGQP